MKKAFMFMFVCACIVLTGNYFTKPAGAQQKNGTSEKSGADGAARVNLAAKFDRLIEQARGKNGGTRVIVGVNTDFKPEGNLEKNAAERQRASIKQAQDALFDKLRGGNIAAVENFEFIPFVVLTADADTLAAMKNFNEITSVQEDELMSSALNRSVNLIGAPQAWDIGFSGAGRTVAVMDTGVDKNHPFFGGRVVSEACYSTNSPADGATSWCPGGAAASTAPNSGLNCDRNFADGCMHGTHVAGIVGGRADNIGRYGVARDVNLIAVQVFTKFSGENCGTNGGNCTLSFTSDQIRGLERVYALRNTYTIDAVNVSIGGGKSTTNCDNEQAAYKAAIDNLRSANIATVIASGNSGYTDGLASPACISTAISVGSTHDGDAGPVDTVSSFSNSASFLTILAPGQLITSSVPGGGYEATQGTSMAAPHVAGAWAILRGKYPNESVSQILDRLISTGKSIIDSRNNIAKKRIRLDHAIGNGVFDPCDPAPIGYNQTINGVITNTDCRDVNRYNDHYSFSGTAGQPISISMNSNAFDAYLYLLSPTGEMIAENDDVAQGNTDARIPPTGTFTLPTTGIYTVVAEPLYNTTFGAYSISLQSTAPNCTYAINPGSANISANGGGGGVAVTTQPGCAWTGATNVPVWASISGASGGAGSGAVNFVVAENYSNQVRTGTLTIAGQTFTINQSGTAAQPTTRPAFDYDGDGKADISVFRPSNGAWYLNQSQAEFTGMAFGQNGDTITPADYDGDGKTDVAVFRGGTWYLLRSQTGFTGITFGLPTDIPVPADYDGDGKADVAVFRPSNGTWYLQQSTAGFAGITFGQNGDRPVAADYDGDSKVDVAVYRNGIWYLNRTNAGFIGIQFGEATDKVVPADYDGDGKADVAVYRPSNGTWYLNRSQTGFTGIQFGIASDVPTPADYDGDGKADVAVFRAGNWYLNRSQTGFTGIQFGVSNDVPTIGAYVR